jgi:hypothetical protein
VRKLASLCLIGVSVLALSACGGGGGSVGGGGGSGGVGGTPGTPNPRPTPTGNPSIKDPATDGLTIAQRLRAGTSVGASRYDGTRLLYSAATNSTHGGADRSLSMQKNVIGGYDIFINNKRISVGSADVKSDGGSWEKIVKNPNGHTAYSVTLWNAGRGGLSGLDTDQQGQTFHKIVGYYVFDNSGTNGVTRDRGHFIIGEPTGSTRVAAMERTATYDGYFYANILPRTGEPLDQSLAVSGGLRLVADFDANTVSGQSTSFAVREAGSYTFNPTSNTLTFESSRIGLGQYHTGQLSSDYVWLNGGYYSGEFYGGNAQEFAGTVNAETGVAVTEGYFTTVSLEPFVPPATTPAP